MNIAVVSVEDNACPQENSLAEKLGIPLLSLDAAMAGDIGYYLQFDTAGLSLYSMQADASGAVRVDFFDPKLNYRVSNATKKQNLVKALGLKRANKLSVLDGTAGLGKDAYLIASLGCRVQMLERSPVVHALLEDGLRRATGGGEEIANSIERMQLLQIDFQDFAAQGKKFDVVYLDPMFPLRSKSARVKKDMYILQKLLGHDEHNAELLPAAMQLAEKRVVVKRAKLSPHIGSEKPDIEFKGKTSRYDVYLCS